MKRAAQIALICIIGGLPASIFAQEQANLHVTAAWSRLAAPGARVLGGYMTVTNEGKSDDMLLGASSPLAKQVTVHRMAVEDGVAKMRQVTEGVTIPAGKSVMFEPGGLHLMLTDPSRSPALNQPIPIKLVFQNAGAVKIILKVLKAPPVPVHAP